MSRFVFVSAVLAALAVGCEARDTREPAPEQGREPRAEEPQGEAPQGEAPQGEAQPDAIGRAPANPAEERAIVEAREAAQHLGRTVKSRLMAAMEEGPDAAIRVCADEAQALTVRAAEERNARVGRSSLRLRNPANDGPEWVTAWLREQGERPAQGVEPSAGIVSDPPVARFVAPIAIEGPCLMCHGAPDAIPASIRTVLDERYPDDRATGYRAGDLRGALWAEVPVN